MKQLLNQPVSLLLQLSLQWWGQTGLIWPSADSSLLLLSRSSCPDSDSLGSVTRPEEKKKKERWHLLSFLLSWARLNVGETGASAHFTPLILLKGRRAGWSADYFTYLVPQLNRDHNHSFFRKMWWKQKAVVLGWLNLEPGDSWLDGVSGLGSALLSIPPSRLLPRRRRSIQSLTFQEAGGHGNGIFDVDIRVPAGRVKSGLFK